MSTRRRLSNAHWDWEYHPGRVRWETYRTPMDWPAGLYDWLNSTFGRPGIDRSGWDYHGGWIYLYKEQYLTMFMLRWA